MVDCQIEKHIRFSGCDCGDPNCKDIIIVQEMVSADDCVDLMMIKDCFGEDPKILLKAPLGWYEINAIMTRWLLGRNTIDR